MTVGLRAPVLEDLDLLGLTVVDSRAGSVSGPGTGGIVGVMSWW